MQFFRRIDNPIERLGVFPGSFNPLTVAHVELARAALHSVDELLFVLPRAFPHKPYRDTTLEQRVEMLETALNDPRYSIAVAEGGLFIEIARECRETYGDAVKLSFLCGRDAAERIATWDYGRPGAWEEMLREFDLLVAPRAGEYTPEEAHSASIAPLPVHQDWDAVSATEVRRRLAAGEPWEHLVPREIHAKVREFYR
jgi:nicotinate-nucleotide adenylyltransferase